MPNYVYNTITIKDKLSEEKLNFLQVISDTEYGGLAQHYLPIGNDHSVDNCKNVWGTKWGCFESSLDREELVLTYSTAWSPLNIEIIKVFAQDFPDFDYEWEEEQGFGEFVSFRNGVLLPETRQEWDIPPLTTEGSIFNPRYLDLEGISYLEDDYTKKANITYKKGYYAEWNLDEFITDDDEVIFRMLKDE